MPKPVPYEPVEQVEPGVVITNREIYNMAVGTHNIVVEELVPAAKVVDKAVVDHEARIRKLEKIALGAGGLAALITAVAAVLKLA